VTATPAIAPAAAPLGASDIAIDVEGLTKSFNGRTVVRNLTAKVSFISKTAEFTPPVIYSLEERSKLVFLIEALPVEPANLRVGQPVDVLLPDIGAKR
jgi:hypothetical protein